MVTKVGYNRLVKAQMARSMAARVEALQVRVRAVGVRSLGRTVAVFALHSEVETVSFPEPARRQVLTCCRQKVVVVGKRVTEAKLCPMYRRFRWMVPPLSFLALALFVLSYTPTRMRYSSHCLSLPPVPHSHPQSMPMMKCAVAAGQAALQRLALNCQVGGLGAQGGSKGRRTREDTGGVVYGTQRMRVNESGTEKGYGQLSESGYGARRERVTKGRGCGVAREA